MPAPIAPKKAMTPSAAAIAIGVSNTNMIEVMMASPPPEVGFEAPLGRAVVLASAKRLRQVVLVYARVRRVVRVLVAGAVAEVLHESRRRVADVERHGLGRPLGHVLLRLVVGDVHGVRLRRERQIERRLGERQLALGIAEEVVGLLRRQGQRERAGVGVADVLRRETTSRRAM